MIKGIRATWGEDGWFSVRLPYEAGGLDMLKGIVPGDQRKWDNETKRWHFAPEAWDKVDLVLHDFYELTIGERPAAARQPKVHAIHQTELARRQAAYFAMLERYNRPFSLTEYRRNVISTEPLVCSCEEAR